MDWHGWKSEKYHQEKEAPSSAIPSDACRLIRLAAGDFVQAFDFKVKLKDVPQSVAFALVGLPSCKWEVKAQGNRARTCGLQARVPWSQRLLTRA